LDKTVQIPFGENFYPKPHNITGFKIPGVNPDTYADESIILGLEDMADLKLTLAAWNDKIRSNFIQENGKDSLLGDTIEALSNLSSPIVFHDEIKDYIERCQKYDEEHWKNFEILVAWVARYLIIALGYKDGMKEGTDLIALNLNKELGGDINFDARLSETIEELFSMIKSNKTFKNVAIDFLRLNSINFHVVNSEYNISKPRDDILHIMRNANINQETAMQIIMGPYPYGSMQRARYFKAHLMKFPVDMGKKYYDYSSYAYLFAAAIYGHYCIAGSTKCISGYLNVIKLGLKIDYNELAKKYYGVKKYISINLKNMDRAEHYEPTIISFLVTYTYYNNKYVINNGIDEPQVHHY
jgi:hypothetical protein